MAQSFFSRHKYWTAFGVVVVIGAIVGLGEYQGESLQRRLTVIFSNALQWLQFSWQARQRTKKRKR
jgi:hypothetical protein